jgi:endonuclease YncB( thermonuclease family)
MGNVRAIDGDTIAADVHVGLGHKAAERIRLKGWWAPEMHGPSAAYGQLAQKRLQAYLDSHICHLLAPGHRRDRYGRLIGSLWYLGRIVPPEQVLAELQLTEETHKAQRDAAKTPLAHLASTPVCQWPDDLIPPYGPASLQDEAFQ